MTPTGIAQVHGVSGPTQAETYLVNIGLPNKVVFASLRVTKGIIYGADVLIGMDIIASGDFSVTNCEGFTKFTYRTPSIKHIDYVEEWTALEAYKAALAKHAGVTPRGGKQPKKKRHRR